MLDRLKQFYQLFQQGQQVSNPAFWKKGQAFVQPIIAGLILTLVAIAKGFGYELPVSDDLAFSIAGGIFFIVNSALTVISSKHIGLPSGVVREAEQAVPNDEQLAKEEPASVQADITPSAGRGGVNPSIDDDVRARAIEWAREHSATNCLANDA